MSDHSSVHAEREAEGSLVEDLKGYHHNALYLIVAIVMIFLTLVLALQPLYLSRVLGLARENAGFVNANIQAITELVDLLFVGYLGYISDRIGRIPLIVYGFLLAGITALLSPFDRQVSAMIGVNVLVIFYVVRVLMSLGGTLIWPQIATLTGDYTRQEDRPLLLANVGFMMAFGVTIVYAVFMQLPEQIGVTPTMCLAGVFALIGAWLAKRLLVEMIQPKMVDRSFPFRDVWNLVKREQGLRLSFLSAFTARNDMVIVGLFLMTWFVYFSDMLEKTSHEQAASRAGLVIGLLGLVVLISIPIWGRVTARIGRVPAIVIGLLISGIGFASMGLILNPFSWGIVIPVIIIGVGQAGCVLVPQTLALDLAPEEIRGSVLGVFNTVGCFGVIFFLQVGGILFDWLGPTTPFIFMGIINLALFVYALSVMKVPHKGRKVSQDLDLSSI
ncbi:Magnetosome protein MamH [Candidatus Magnetaquicoccaceae bacterium FCR-1]|uniref:Magnetosome protein MamH n=1 Tax=Candidatus Magnetaquiglobus chichijimensis TaxID=3141448 RepID=A0ABQ0CAH5_9PROT